MSDCGGWVGGRDVRCERCQGSIMSDQFSVITASHCLLLPRLAWGSDKGSDFLIKLQEINFAFLPRVFCQKFFL